MVTRFVLTALFATFAATGSAATFSGSFWDTDTTVNSIGLAVSHAENNDPTATFSSTRIDYPKGQAGSLPSTMALADFLGADAASLSGAGDTILTGSVFHWSGMLDLKAGERLFSVSSDDGFRLKIEGLDRLQWIQTRSFRASEETRTVAADGLYQFDLWFFDRGGAAGIEFKIDGELASPAVVPLAPSAAMSLAALVGLVALRRRSRS